MKKILIIIMSIIIGISPVLCLFNDYNNHIDFTNQLNINGSHQVQLDNVVSGLVKVELIQPNTGGTTATGVINYVSLPIYLNEDFINDYFVYLNLLLIFLIIFKIIFKGKNY